MSFTAIPLHYKMSVTETELLNCRPKFTPTWSGGQWLISSTANTS